MKSLLWIALVAGCSNGGNHAPPKKERPADVVKAEWTPKLQAKLAKIVAAAKAAEGADLGAAGDAHPALDFDWHEEGKPNAIAVQVDDVQSATTPRPKPPAPLTADEKIQALADGKPLEELEVTHPRFTFQADEYNQVFEGKRLLGIEESSVGPEYHYDQLVNAKYVLVVAPSDLQWADPQGSTFQGGHVHLRATLVEIETGKALGGFETDGKSSDKVLIDPDSLTDPKYRNKLYADLDRDLMIESSKAIVAGIQQRWPDLPSRRSRGSRTGEAQDR